MFRIIKINISNLYTVLTCMHIMYYYVYDELKG